MDTRKNILTRAYLVYGVVLLVCIAIIGKIIYIQFAEGNEWREKAKKISLRYFTIEANRGNIYDCKGEMLATSIPLFELRMDVASSLIHDTIFKKNVDSLAYELSHYFKDKTKQQYKKLLTDARSANNRYLLLKRKITYDDLRTIRTFPIFRLGKNKGGMITTVQNQRMYPFGHLAYRTIGFYKEENPNNVGIEGAFNNKLEGEQGQRLYQRIPNDNWKPLGKENTVEPKDGSDIITTIDINLQDVAEESLLRQLELHKADHGCAIVMEVKTGAIKAMANLGKTKQDTYEELYNYAIGESAEPGSTFKLFSLLAALDDKKVVLTDRVDITGGVTRYANRTMKDSHGGGILTVKEVFEKSSNVGTSKIITQAYGANPQAYIDKIYSFGVNKPLGLEIAGEGNPVIKSTKARSWSKVSLPWMSIGYEVALTPLQILNFYNAVANNGVMVKPYIVKEIRKSGIPAQSFSTQIINKQIASKEAIADAQAMLEGVVDHGTGSALRNPIYKVAGKTGTAQIAQKSSGYNKVNYKGSFVCYFPADNPKYSCIVVISNPTSGKYYGGTIAAPVVREIADRIYATDPDVGHNWVDSSNTIKSNPLKSGCATELKYLSEWLGYKSNFDPSVEWYSLGNDSITKTSKVFNMQTRTLPNVVGMGARDAVYLLEKLGLHVQIKGLGLVRSQSLAAGSTVNPGSTITLNMAIKQ